MNLNGKWTQKCFDEVVQHITHNFGGALWTRNAAENELTRLAPNPGPWVALKDAIAQDPLRRLGTANVQNYAELVANGAWVASQSPWQMLLNDFGDAYS